MRLFFIDKPECRHISEIVKGVSVIYQMEEEFYPYLVVDFLPNKTGKPGGVIIQAGQEIIRKNYTFENPKDEKELRSLLWKLVRKYHNPKDITETKNGKTCIKDFRKTETNNVIQGWQAKKRNMRNGVCCRVVSDTISKDLTDFFIKHWAYRDPTTPKLNRKTCKKIRFEECGNNYPPGTHDFDRCVKEVNWLCDRGYSGGLNRKKAMDEFVKKTKVKLYKELDKNNLRVNKRLFDELITAGLFEHVGNRMGNRAINNDNVQDTLNRTLWEKQHYLNTIEDFGPITYLDQEYMPTFNRLWNEYTVFWLILMVLVAFVFAKINW